MKRLICVALALLMVTCMAVDVSAADRLRTRSQDGTCLNDGSTQLQTQDRLQDQTCPDCPCSDPACDGNCSQDCEPQQDRSGWNSPEEGWFQAMWRFFFGG